VGLFPDILIAIVKEICVLVVMAYDDEGDTQVSTPVLGCGLGSRLLPGYGKS
jgi:hypothetical protein